MSSHCPSVFPRARCCKKTFTSWVWGSLLTLPSLAGASPSPEVVAEVVPSVEELVVEFEATGATAGLGAPLGPLTQRSPDDGAPPTPGFETRIHLVRDEDHLGVFFDARDPEPSRLRATLAGREDFPADDAVRLYLDTFGDAQRAYVFRLNPLGVQWDAVWSEANGWDTSWDTVWRSGGRLTATGYRVWMVLPFRSLRFRDLEPTEEHRWGLIVGREVARDQAEETYWPAVTQRRDGWLGQAGALRGLRALSSGRNLQAIPFATAREFEILDPDSSREDLRLRDGEQDVGIDAKWVLKDRFVLDATWNPDFSQIESDRPQITVNRRFEAFFPERRPFFLENADLFRTPLNLLFTRRIADPDLGVRFTGKAADATLGLLWVDDRAPGLRVGQEDPRSGRSATFGVARVAWELPRQSRLGFLATHRGFADESDDVVAVDGRWKLGDHWVTAGQVARSRTSRAERESEGSAVLLTVNRSGRDFNYSGSYRDVSDDFEAAAGFLTRFGIRQTSHFASYWFWGDDSRVIRWGPELFTQVTWGRDGARLDDYAEASLEWHWPHQTYVEINVGTGETLLRPDEFPSLAASRGYPNRAVVLELGSSPGRRLGWSSNLAWRRSINFAPPDGEAPRPADVASGNVQATWQALRRLRFDVDWLFETVEDRASGDRAFSSHVWRVRAGLQPTRALSARVILEYRTLRVDPRRTRLERGRGLNADLLLTYRVNPWTALHLGANRDDRNLAVDTTPAGPAIVTTDRALETVGRQVFFKVSYLVR